MKKMLVLAVLLTACCPSRKYPDDIRNDFLVRCGKGGASVMTCICVMEGIEKRYTIDEYLVIAGRTEKGEPLPEEIEAITDRCALEEREHDKEKKR